MEFAPMAYPRPARAAAKAESDAAVYATSERVKVRNRAATRLTQVATVHTACAILANNRFEGWLSSSTDREDIRASLKSASSLSAGLYSFHVPSTDVNEHGPYRPPELPLLGISTRIGAHRVAPSREDTHGDGGRVNERRSPSSDQLPSWSSILPHHSIYGEELVY